MNYLSKNSQPCQDCVMRGLVVPQIAPLHSWMRLLKVVRRCGAQNEQYLKQNNTNVGNIFNKLFFTLNRFSETFTIVHCICIERIEPAWLKELADSCCLEGKPHGPLQERRKRCRCDLGVFSYFSLELFDLPLPVVFQRSKNSHIRWLNDPRSIWE